MEPIPPSVIPPQPPTTSPPPPPPIPSPPPPPPVSPVSPPPKKKSFTWLLILVILFLLASTGVLAYQYYQLKAQLANPRFSQSLVPSPTPIPSQDPTADWKIYTAPVNFSLRGSYSIEYSEEDVKIKFDEASKREESIGEDVTTITNNDIKRNQMYEVEEGMEINIVFIGKEEPQTQLEEPTEKIKVGDMVAKKKVIVNKVGTIIEYRLPLPRQPVNSQEYVQARAFIAGSQSQTYIQLTDLILSTFKFTN